MKKEVKEKIDKAYSDEMIEDLGYDFLEKMLPIQSFEDACKIEGLDPEKVIPDFSCYPEKHRKSMIAHAILVITIGAANKVANDGEEWFPDFTNPNEWKYENWYDMSGGPSGLRFSDYVGWRTHSHAGSRLSFFGSNVGKYIFYQFTEYLRDYLF